MAQRTIPAATVTFALKASAVSEVLPLFPLGLVLLPGTRVPLHIFEDRYRVMVAECVENKSEFAMMYGTDDDFRPIGCAARVTDIVNRFADGRLNVVIMGTDRVRLIERHDDKPYISGVIERVADEAEPPNDALVTETRARYEEALKLSIGWLSPSGQAADPGELSYTIASALSLPPDQQQSLLEQTSIGERFTIVNTILEETLDQLREHSRKTASNGTAH